MRPHKMRPKTYFKKLKKYLNPFTPGAQGSESLYLAKKKWGLTKWSQKYILNLCLSVSLSDFSLVSIEILREKSF